MGYITCIWHTDSLMIATACTRSTFSLGVTGHTSDIPRVPLFWLLTWSALRMLCAAYWIIRVDTSRYSVTLKIRDLEHRLREDVGRKWDPFSMRVMSHRIPLF